MISQPQLRNSEKSARPQNQGALWLECEEPSSGGVVTLMSGPDRLPLNAAWRGNIPGGRCPLQDKSITNTNSKQKRTRPTKHDYCPCVQERLAGFGDHSCRRRGPAPPSIDHWMLRFVKHWVHTMPTWISRPCQLPPNVLSCILKHRFADLPQLVDRGLRRHPRCGQRRK